MKKEFEGMTLAEVKSKIVEMVNTYNKSTDPAERATIQVQSADFVKAYNELSKLNLYSKAMAAKIPEDKDHPDRKPTDEEKAACKLSFLIKTHHYGKADIKFEQSVAFDENKRAVSSVTASCSFDGTTTADMFDFIEWAEKANKKVTASGNWKVLTAVERERLNDEFRKSNASETEHKISKRTANDVLQKCFDALIFVPGGSGKNAIFPNTDCKNLIVNCGAEYKEKIKDDNDVDCGMTFYARKRWQNNIQRALYLILKNKKITYSYGDPEDTNAVLVEKSGKKSTAASKSANGKKKSAKEETTAPADKKNTADKK